MRNIYMVFVMVYTVAYVITLRLLDAVVYVLPVLIPVGIVMAVIFFGVSKVPIDTAFSR